MAGTQNWKHGWIPLTPGAARQKNHGSKPGPKSKLSQQMDAAIRGKAKNRGSSTSTADDLRARTAKLRAIRQSSERTRKAVASRTPQKPAASKLASKASAATADVEAATAAIKAGDTAKAVNLLTRAAGKASTPAEKKKIKAQRDALARKLMGR